MNPQKILQRQIIGVLLGEAACMALVVAVFALLGRYDTTVLLGAAAGIVLAVANFWGMAFMSNLAADKAQAQDVAGGQKLIALSYTVRMVALFALLALCALSGWFHVVTLVVPLALVRPILTAMELFSKKGGKV